MNNTITLRHLGFVVTALAGGLLAGCGSSGSLATTVSSGGGGTQAHASGTVFGGQQPVSGATIQLYSVGTTGNASTATPLISSTVTTDSNGNFNITGKYSCASATQVYIVATGGNAGVGSNSALSLMAAIGSCSSLTSTSFLSINELTTIAAVTALAPFMDGYQSVGATGTNPSGLVNAFQMAQVLVNTGTGTIPATSGITLPNTKLNTLADIVAACVNTAGPTSTACTTLLNATGASETIGAALAIAQSPGSASFTSLWSLPSGSPPYQPTLTSQPNDFTVAVKYSSASLSAPYGIAIDASGNGWITNEAGSSVVELPAISASVTPSTFTGGGLLAPRGISIDRSGNVWVANTGGNSVVELSSAGAVLSGSGYTGGSISGPVAIANDSAGNAWVANATGSSITELAANGAASGASPITTSLSAPTAIALDSTGRVAVANEGNGAVCFFSNTGALQECATDNTLFGAMGVAISTSGNVALAGSTTGSSVAGAFTLASNTGAVDPASPIAGGGLTLPTAVAYDGANVAWFANMGSVSAFSGTTALTGASGWGSFSAPSGIAVDASGNLWITGTGDNSVSIIVGVATPVTTPLAVNVGP